jgi:hypothetical protein
MHLVEAKTDWVFKLFCGSSSVGRATAFQAVGRGFEPRLPLSVEITGDRGQLRVSLFVNLQRSAVNWHIDKPL